MKQTQLSYPTAALMAMTALSFQTTTHKPSALSTLPTAQPNTVDIRDGEVVLFKRSRSRIWQCRFKLDDQRWLRQTTGHATLARAVESAGKLYDQARFAQQMGLTPTRKTFTQIAQFTVEEMRRERAAGTGKM